MKENEEITREALQKPLIEAIRETNRCLYLWNHSTIKKSFANRADSMGLLKTWICKTGVRSLMGYHETNIITGPYVYLKLNEDRTYIEQWDLDSVLNVYSYYSRVSTVHKILRDVNLYDLRYIPDMVVGPNSMYTNYCHQENLVDYIKKINFTKIENLKYGE